MHHFFIKSNKLVRDRNLLLKSVIFEILQNCEKNIEKNSQKQLDFLYFGTQIWQGLRWGGNFLTRFGSDFGFDR